MGNAWCRSIPGWALEKAAGFQFHERLRTVNQVPELSDIVLTHGDSDHAGGLADFPQVPVHLAEEELAAVQAGHALPNSVTSLAGDRMAAVSAGLS